jgi:hypothetical protein
MVYLITYVTGVFQITNVKIGPTEVRVLAILANITILIVGNPSVNLPFIGVTTLYTLIVGFMAVLMTLYFLINTSIQARKLKLLDEKRLERKMEKMKRAADAKEKDNSNPA